MSTHHDVASTATPAAYDTPVPPACGASCAPPPPTYGAHSEPAPGGTSRSARMVPPGNDMSSLFSATPLHLPRLPTASVLQPQQTDPTHIAATSPFAPSQYPTPNVAYVPYPTVPPVQMHMYSPPPPQPPVHNLHDNEVACLTAQVHALTQQVRHLTTAGAASPTPMVDAPMHVPLACIGPFRHHCRTASRRHRGRWLHMLRLLLRAARHMRRRLQFRRPRRRPVDAPMTRRRS